MREVTMWVADDGTKFDNRRDCREYEFQQRKNAVGNDLQMYTSYYAPCEAVEDATIIIARTQAAKSVLEEYCDNQGIYQPSEQMSCVDNYDAEDVVGWYYDETREEWYSLNFLKDQVEEYTTALSWMNKCLSN